MALFRVAWPDGREVTNRDLDTIAWNEPWAKGLIYSSMDGFALDQDGGLLLMDSCGNYRYPPVGTFLIVWDETFLGIKESPR